MKKILLVEDDIGSLKNIAAFLRAEGYEVAEARDGDEAFEQLLRPINFDLILTDIRMPRADGIRLLQRVRVISPDIPVILMTAFESSEVHQEGISFEADDFISKPFTLDQLLQKINRAIESKRLT